MKARVIEYRNGKKRIVSNHNSVATARKAARKRRQDAGTIRQRVKMSYRVMVQKYTKSKGWTNLPQTLS